MGRLLRQLRRWLSVVGVQALLTKRKGNKKFAVFDLKLTLAWEGKWSMEDAENPTAVSACIPTLKTSTAV